MIENEQIIYGILAGACTAFIAIGFDKLLSFLGIHGL